MNKNLIKFIILFLFANFSFANKIYNFQYHIKYSNIKNSGLKNSFIYGISYNINYKFKNNFGIKYGFEGDLGIFKEETTLKKIPYTSLSWVLAPFYIYNNIQLFTGIKYGYFLFDKKVQKFSDTEGNLFMGTIGLKYIFNNKINIEFEFNKGNIYFKSTQNKINEYGISIGYQF